MATFEVKVRKIEIEEHPNADALELARIDDYRAVVQKGKYKSGDLVVYIPEQAVLPDWLIKELNLEGKLAGKNKNRVKPAKIRQMLSQGLVLPVEDVPEKAISNAIKFKGTDGKIHHQCILEGEEVSDILGIEKYEPPIPVHMSGDVFNAYGMTLKYDIENIQKYPDVLKKGEAVVITEKIHGTWCCFGYHPEAPHHIVTSKGLSEKGLAFKFNGNNAKNLYIRALNSTIISEVNVLERYHKIFGYDTPVYLLGEVFGKGIQDLSYGQDDINVRLFDVYIGYPGQGYYLDPIELKWLAKDLDINIVPKLYSGPFFYEKVKELTSGNETVSGTESNIREGVVIRPRFEREDPYLGRVILKSVSEQYLTRKNGTEYN